jgi:hypothetical protein
MDFCKILFLWVQFYFTDGSTTKYFLVNTTKWLSGTWFVGYVLLHKMFILVNSLVSCLCLIYHDLFASFSLAFDGQSLVSGTFIAVIVLL